MSIAEQRTYPRNELNQTLRLWHPQAGRLYPVRILNHSQCGVLISASMRCPLRQGQYVELQMSDSELHSGEACPARQLARVIRVDRINTLEEATIKAGLMFCENPR